MAVKDNDIIWVPAASVPVVTGNNATIALFDPTATTAGSVLLAATFGSATGGVYPQIHRVIICCKFDQAVTINQKVKATVGGSYDTINNSGSGDSLTASTRYAKDFLNDLAPYTKYEIVTGATGPTTTEVAIGFVFTRALGFFG